MSDRIKHAERLESLVDPMRGFAMIDEAAIRTGASALRELEAMDNIPHEVECGTFVESDEPRRESTITLPLSEWKQLRPQRDAIAAEAGRLRERIESAEAQVAALREVLDSLALWAGCAIDDPIASGRYQAAKTAISQTAATASRYKARVRAETLLELVAKLLDESGGYGKTIGVKELRDMADAAEREAL